MPSKFLLTNFHRMQSFRNQMPPSISIALGSLAVLFVIGCSDQSPTPLHQEVNPFIGTGGHGHTYPGATSPFGMVQLSPDTRLTGWDGCGGYHYSDTAIYGFQPHPLARHRSVRLWRHPVHAVHAIQRRRGLHGLSATRAGTPMIQKQRMPDITE